MRILGMFVKTGCMEVPRSNSASKLPINRAMNARHRFKNNSKNHKTPAWIGVKNVANVPNAKLLIVVITVFTNATITSNNYHEIINTATLNRSWVMTQPI